MRTTLQDVHVTLCGKIIRKRDNRVMKQSISPNGYLKWQNYTVSRLVAHLHIPNPEGKPHVHHKDRDRKNPKVNNLQWVGTLEHAWIHHYGSTGEKFL